MAENGERDGYGGYGGGSMKYWRVDCAMRALRFPDAFPAADLSVRKALVSDGQPLPSENQVLACAAAWRPSRACATLHLWQTLDDAAHSATL